MARMKNNKMTILKEAVETEFLPSVRRPSRYIGGEVNQIKKDLNNCDLTFALCFPDIYEIAMSHTGLAIIYDVLNKLKWAAAERVFSLWPDAEDVLLKKNIRLFTLESKAAVSDFDVLGFSITSELCYTNILKILDLANIPLRAKDRNNDEPLIIGGAGMSNCCEPIAEFFDMFILGEAEEAVVKIARHLRDSKKHGLSKQQTLCSAAQKFDFVYVPSLYEFQYDREQIKSFKPVDESLPVTFKNAFVKNLDNSTVPLAPIVPFADVVHERISVEVMRGCPGRCRFCQASYCRRPLRFRSPERIFEIARAVYQSTGFDTVSLLSLSTADYPYLEEVIEKLGAYFESLKVGISLPSLRVDTQLKLLPKLTSNVRKGGLTIAVEAASEKLRNIINKPITNENLFTAIKAAYKEGFSKVKLYFMVGFASETKEDIEAIADLCFELAQLRKSTGSGPAQITAAVSWLVPKPHTPFGWLGQKNVGYFENAKKIILSRKKQIRARTVQFKFHDIYQSTMEAAIARADRRLADVIEHAYKNGAMFDLWSEHFNFELWEKAFQHFGMDINDCAQRKFEPDEILPWQHLGGPEKDYLLGHYNNAVSE